VIDLIPFSKHASKFEKLRDENKNPSMITKKEYKIENHHPFQRSSLENNPNNESNLLKGGIPLEFNSFDGGENNNRLLGEGFMYQIESLGNENSSVNIVSDGPSEDFLIQNVFNETRYNLISTVIAHVIDRRRGSLTTDWPKLLAKEQKLIEIYVSTGLGLTTTPSFNDPAELIDLLNIKYGTPRNEELLNSIVLEVNNIIEDVFICKNQINSIGRTDLRKKLNRLYSENDYPISIFCKPRKITQKYISQTFNNKKYQNDFEAALTNEYLRSALFNRRNRITRKLREILKDYFDEKGSLIEQRISLEQNGKFILPWSLNDLERGMLICKKILKQAKISEP
jgi:hypothetical protein